MPTSQQTLKNLNVIEMDVITNCSASNRNSADEPKKHNSKATSSTKTLLLIASVFLVLNFPIVVHKTLFFVERNRLHANEAYQQIFADSQNCQFKIDADLVVSLELNTNRTVQFDTRKEIKSFQIKEIFAKLAAYMFYLNFSINFFLYSFNTKQFRGNLFKMLLQK